MDLSVTLFNHTIGKYNVTFSYGVNGLKADVFDATNNSAIRQALNKRSIHFEGEQFNNLELTSLYFKENPDRKIYYAESALKELGFTN